MNTVVVRTGDSDVVLTLVEGNYEYCFFFFFFLLWFNVPVNNFSVMLRRSHLFLGITSTFWGVNVSCSRKQTHRPGRGYCCGEDGRQRCCTYFGGR